MNPLSNTSLGRFVLLILCGLLTTQLLQAQLTQGEYFFDTDPGVSKAIPFSIPEELYLDGEFTFDTEGLDPGTHLLGLRVKDGDHWGFTEIVEFYVEPAVIDETNRGFLKGEYFIDTDPGVGSATPFAVEAGAFTENDLEIDLSNLPPGDHLVGVRYQNADKVWSFTEVSAFTIEPIDGIDQDYLTKVSYNIYNKAGELMKTGDLAVENKPSSIDTDLDIDISGLPEGDYVLETYVRNETGLRGHDRTLQFSVIDGDSPETISLSNSEVEENQPIGTVVGSLSTDDVDQDDTHTYTLVAGSGDEDNAAFTIEGDQLKTVAIFDFATKSSYSIRVRSTDLGELFTEQTFTVTVIDEKEDQTITFTEIGIDTYGDTETLIATASSGLDVTFESSDPTIATVTGNELKFIGVGEVIISAIQAGNDTYGAEELKQTLQVSKAVLAVTADDKTKVYGEDNPELTAAYSGFVNGDDQNSLTAEPVLSTSANTASGAGVYDITPSGGTSDHYEFSLASGQLTVTKAVLSIVADDQSRIYGGENPELTMTYAGFVNGDDSNSLTQEPVIATTALATSDAGGYAITLSEGASDNYSFGLTDGLLTVTKAALSTLADNKTKVYGEDNPELTITYSGFVNGDDENSLTEQPVITTSATVNSNVGVYDISTSGGTSTNYDFSYTNGQLTITQASLVAIADDQTRPYGAENPTLTVSYIGFVNGDEVGSLTQIPAITTTAGLESSPGGYEIMLSGGQDDNYALSLNNGQLTVTKATLLVTADNKTRVYGDVNPVLTFSYEGFVNGDDENDLTSALVISTMATSASDAGSYAITLTGAEDNNYAYQFVDGVLSVTKAVLVAEADDATRNKGEDNPEFSISYSGFVNGDGVSDLDALPTISTSATSESDRGTYDIVPSGGSDNNYSFDFRNGLLTVTGPVFTLPGSIDFGQVNSGESKTESVVIQNTGDGPLTVSAINPPPGFLVDQAAFDLAVSETVTLIITFSPTEGRAYSGNLVIASNDGTSLIPLTGEGMLVTSLDDEVLDEEEVKTYPNPAINELVVDISAGPAGPVNLSLTDLKGQERLSLIDVRERRVTLDVSSYRMGIYILRIEGRKGTVFKKVMIER